MVLVVLCGVADDEAVRHTPGRRPAQGGPVTKLMTGSGSGVGPPSLAGTGVCPCWSGVVNSLYIIGCRCGTNPSAVVCTRTGLVLRRRVLVSRASTIRVWQLPYRGIYGLLA